MDQKTTYSYQRTPGLDCPKCGVYFPTTIPDLLSGSIRCPYCGLTLYIDRKASGHAGPGKFPERIRQAASLRLPVMKKPLIILSAVLCMVLPSLSPAEMRQREPRQLAAAWQEVKKQIADDGKTIRVRDGIQALELLAELGISSVPADGVRLSRGSLTIVVTRGKKEDGVFYVLAVKEEGGANLEVKMVPPS